MTTSAPRIAVLAPSGPPVLTTHRSSPIRIGRAPDNDIVVQDPALSRHHAEIRATSDGWLVLDRNSRNGTRLDGLALDGPTALTTGSRITVGSTDLVFEPRAAGRSAAVTAAATDPDDRDGRNDPDPSDTAAGVGVRSDGPDPRDGAEGLPPLVGESDAMQTVRRMLGRFARSTATVLITGETGTGKDVAARWLHALSPRAREPFVVIDCGALPTSLVEAELFGTEAGVATGVAARPGRLEIADSGTIFLDEIGELEQAVQSRLLRFLQERTVERIGARNPKRLDVRVIAATNRPLARLVDEGRFRRDLLMRLDVASLILPPLRERIEDVPALARHVLRSLNAHDVRIDPDVFAAFEQHPWPGNVRELEHALERALLLSSDGVLRARDLPPAVRQATRSETGDVVARAVEPERLLERITSGSSSFWSAVRVPYLRRELAREQVRDVVALARARGGGTWRGASSVLDVESEYKRFVDFLRNHRLRPEDDSPARYPSFPSRDLVRDFARDFEEPDAPKEIS